MAVQDKLSQTMSEETARVNRRRHPRVLVALRCSFSGGHPVREGTVLDLSKQGARLRLDAPVLSGECFDLLIHLSDREQPLAVGRAVARWSKGRECGVEFASPSQELATSMDLSHPAQRIESPELAVCNPPRPVHVHDNPVRTREAVRVAQGHAFLFHVCAGVILLIAAAVIQAYENRTARLLGERLRVVAEEVADRLDRAMAERYREIQEVARTVGTRGYNPQVLTDRLRQLKESDPLYLWVGRLDHNGRIVAATDPALIGQDLSRNNGLGVLRDLHGSFVSHSDVYQESRGLEAIAVTVSIVSPSGEFLGALTSRVSVAGLHDAVVKPTVSQQQSTMTLSGALEYQVVNQQGMAFIDSDHVRNGGANVKELGAVSALLNETGIAGYVKEEHLRRHVPTVTGYARMQGVRGFPGLRWGVFVRQDQSRIFASIQERLRTWSRSSARP